MKSEERIDYSGIPVGTRVYISFTGFLGTPIGSAWVVVSEDACHYGIHNTIHQVGARIPKKNVRTER